MYTPSDSNANVTDSELMKQMLQLIQAQQQHNQKQQQQQIQFLSNQLHQAQNTNHQLLQQSVSNTTRILDTVSTTQALLDTGKVSGKINMIDLLDTLNECSDQIKSLHSQVMNIQKKPIDRDQLFAKIRNSHHVTIQQVLDDASDATVVELVEQLESIRHLHDIKALNSQKLKQYAFPDVVRPTKYDQRIAVDAHHIFIQNGMTICAFTAFFTLSSILNAPNVVPNYLDHLIHHNIQVKLLSYFYVKFYKLPQWRNSQKWKIFPNIFD